VFAQVLYSQHAADDVLNRVLDNQADTVTKGNVRPATAQRQLTHALALLRILFKDGAYQAENEWRLVILDRYGTLQKAIDTRIVDGVLVPYIPVPISPPTEGNAAFVEVVCGPARDRRRNVLTGVVDLLMRFDPSEYTKRSESEVPYRGSGREGTRV